MLFRSPQKPGPSPRTRGEPGGREGAPLTPRAPARSASKMAHTAVGRRSHLCTSCRQEDSAPRHRGPLRTAGVSLQHDSQLPPGEQSIPDTARRKPQCLLWPNLKSGTSLLPYSVIRGKSLRLAHKQGNGDEAPSFEGRGIKKFMDIFSELARSCGQGGQAGVGLDASVVWAPSAPTSGGQGSGELVEPRS